MASTITIYCPECDQPLKAPSDAAGKKIRCKACGATFATPKDKAKPAKKEKAAKGGAEEEEVKSYIMREEYLGRRCPECANAMEEEDRICLHCGYDTHTRDKSQMRKVRETTGLDIFVWLLPGILCALVALILLTALTLMWIFINMEVFGDAWYSFIGHLSMRIYVSVMGLWIIYVAGKFAIRRLILHYLPPEIEEKVGGGDER